MRISDWSSDVCSSDLFAPNPPTRTVNVHEVAADEMILDVGPAAVEALSDVLKNCKTLVWNGPLGAFETPPLDTATVALAKKAAALTTEGSLVSVRSQEHTSALQPLMRFSYAVICFNK